MSSGIVIPACAAAFAMIWLLGSRSPKARSRLRGLYVDDGFPFILRASIPLAPLWGVSTLLFWLLLLVPRSTAMVLSIPVLSFALVVFILAHRVPPPLAPRWLRDDFAAGVTPAAPSRSDWLLFWAIIVIAAIGIVAILVLLTIGVR